MSTRSFDELLVTPMRPRHRGPQHVRPARVARTSLGRLLLVTLPTLAGLFSALTIVLVIEPFLR